MTIFHFIASVGWVTVDDDELYPTSQAPSSAAMIASDTVTRTQSNQITADTIDNGTTQLNSSYGYDNGDRLTSATIGTHSYSYGFGTQNSTTCGTGSGTNANSGKSGNRTSQTIDGATTYFCYDYADKLTGSNNALYNTISYDAHGNMTYMGSGAQPIRFCYDSSDRNWCIIQRDDNADAGTAIYYSRDVQGRITYHEKDDIDHWTWNLVNWTTNGYTGSGDTPDFIRDENGNIVEKDIELPGGVVVIIKPQQTGNNQKSYNLPNIHGDTLLTTNAAGTNTSNGNGPANSFTYDPFGNVLAGSVLPANTVNGSYGYVGQHEKLTESRLTLTPVQMGVRIYLPTIGRFIQIDMVDGGVDNNYVYPTDPINELDLNGQFKIKVPKFIKGYTHWLFGGGKSKTVKAKTVKWSLSKKDIKKVGTGKVTTPIGASATGFDNSEYIGRVAGNFRGTITKTSTGYRARGTFTPNPDHYDFNNDPSRGYVANGVTTLGQSSGDFAKRMSGGMIKPTGYVINFEGSANIDETW